MIGNALFNNKKNTVKWAVIVLLIISNIVFALKHLKYESLYQWHHLKYHELKSLITYRDKYPNGTLMAAFIAQEKDYQKEHIWCQNNPNALCVEPTLSDWQYSHYCGFTFTFEDEKLVSINSNSPCH